MADEADSKSVVGNNVRVQVPLPAVIKIAEMLVKSRYSAIFIFWFLITLITFFTNNARKGEHLARMIFHNLVNSRCYV